MHGACQMRIPLQRNLRHAAVAAATAASVVFCRPIAAALGTNRFMLAPCTNERDPYGQAAGAVRAVVKELKDLRTSTCVAVVAPVGTNQNPISTRKLAAFKEQVRVRKQLGSFPEVVTVKVASPWLDATSGREQQGGGRHRHESRLIDQHPRSALHRDDEGYHLRHQADGTGAAARTHRIASALQR